METLSRNNVSRSIKHNTEWTENLEDIVKSWALKAVLQREMHNKSAKYYKGMSTRVTLPLIMLTTLTSVGSFGAVDSAQYKIWMYATGGLNLVAAFLASVMKFLKPDERCSMHTRMSKLFDMYHRGLTVQLGLAPDERERPDELIERAKKEMEELMNESPMVSDKVVNSVVAKHNIEVPNDFEIAIYGRAENKDDEMVVDADGVAKKKPISIRVD